RWRETGSEALESLEGCGGWELACSWCRKNKSSVGDGSAALTAVLHVPAEGSVAVRLLCRLGCDERIGYETEGEARAVCDGGISDELVAHLGRGLLDALGRGEPRGVELTARARRVACPRNVKKVRLFEAVPGR